MLAVAGGKGGVGKTTVVLALGRVLADAGHRPLLVDCDRDVPDLARRAGLLADPTDRQPKRPTGLAALADGVPLDDLVSEPRAYPGVSLLPAGRRGGARTALSSLAWEGPVVLDCPPGAGRDAVEPLRVADRTLLVSSALPEGLRDARKTARMARATGAPPAGLLLTRCASHPDGTDRLFDCPTLTVARSPSPITEYISLFESQNIMSDIES